MRRATHSLDVDGMCCKQQCADGGQDGVVLAKHPSAQLHVQDAHNRMQRDIDGMEGPGTQACMRNFD